MLILKSKKKKKKKSLMFRHNQKNSFPVAIQLEDLSLLPMLTELQVGWIENRKKKKKEKKTEQ